MNSRKERADKPVTILLLDENPAEVRKFSEILSRAEETVFTVRCADQMAAGMEIISGGGIDAVLVSISLLMDNSRETIARLRGNPPHTAVIVISGGEHEKLAKAAVDGGARDYLITEKVGADWLVRSIHYAVQFEHMEQALSEFEHMKSEFIAGLSHELRIPLHSIQGFTQLLREGSVTDEVTRDEFLSIINQQSGRLSGLIDVLLDASCVSPGQFKLEKRRAPFYNVVRNAVEDVALSAMERDITIKEDVSATLVEMVVDRLRMQQVIAHLLHNAVKFSADGSQVDISAAVRGDELEMSISDSGIGIPEESLPYIFQRFYQVKDRNRVDGVGMGLYFSQQIILAHKGRIRAESKPGKGSKFTFTLPLPKQTKGSSRDE